MMIAVRYEDFTECFSLWCEEQPDASSSVFNTVSQHMESLITVRELDLMRGRVPDYRTERLRGPP